MKKLKSLVIFVYVLGNNNKITIHKYSDKNSVQFNGFTGFTY